MCCFFLFNMDLPAGRQLCSKNNISICQSKLALDSPFQSINSSSIISLSIFIRKVLKVKKSLNLWRIIRSLFIHLNLFQILISISCFNLKSVKHQKLFNATRFLKTLKSLIPLLSNYLLSKLQPTLHPKKIYLQHYIKGYPFRDSYQT